MVSLYEEIGLIEEFVALERRWIREYSFHFDSQITGETRKTIIPPLIVFTMIENAFKHGIRKCRNNGWITMYIEVKNSLVVIKILNSLQECSQNEEEEKSPSGFGIKAVRHLLSSNFRNPYYLNARPIGNIFAVDLIIDKVSYKESLD